MKHILSKKGWIALVLLKDDGIDVKVLKENDIYTVLPNTVHNCYLSKGTEFHGIKHGIIEENDWYGNEELNKLTKHLSEEELLKFKIKDGVKKI